MASSRISYLWNDPHASQGFRTAVSLHSHTSESRESLSSVAKFGSQYALMRRLMARLERRSEANHGLHTNYKASFWTPPLAPKRAFDLESQQIEKLDMAPMVSLTDHDNLRAPQALRCIAGLQSTPVSVEWTAPYGEQSFHLGIHNLPAATATRMDGNSRRLYRQPQRPSIAGNSRSSRRCAGSSDRLQPRHVGSLSGRYPNP